MIAVFVGPLGVVCSYFDGRYPIECVKGAPDPLGWLFWYTLIVTGVTVLVWPALRSFVDWIMYGPVLEVQLMLIALELAWLGFWYDVLGGSRNDD